MICVFRFWPHLYMHVSMQKNNNNICCMKFYIHIYYCLLEMFERNSHTYTYIHITYVYIYIYICYVLVVIWLSQLG